MKPAFDNQIHNYLIFPNTWHQNFPKSDGNKQFLINHNSKLKEEEENKIQNQTIANFTNTYRGGDYESYFYLSNSLNEADRKQIFRNKVVNGGYELIDFNLLVPPRDSAKIYLSFSARSNKVYKVYGNDLIIDVLPLSIPRFDDPQKRKLPVQIDYPSYCTDSLEYEIPMEYTIAGKLANESVNSEFGNYRIESSLKGKKVSVVKSFRLKSGIYSLDTYPDFYKFLTRVIDIESNNKIVSNKKIKDYLKLEFRHNDLMHITPIIKD